MQDDATRQARLEDYWKRYFALTNRSHDGGADADLRAGQLALAADAEAAGDEDFRLFFTQDAETYKPDADVPEDARKALAVIDEALAWERQQGLPEAALLTLAHGMTNFNLGKIVEAEADSTRLIETLPGEAGAWRLRCWVLMGQGKYPAAKDAIEKALQLNPEGARNWELRAKLHSRMRETAEAMTCFLKTLELAPNCVTVRWEMAGYYLALGAEDRAIDCCDEMIRLRPGEAMYYVIKGNVLYVQKKYAEALACYVQAEKVNPKYPLTFWNRGNTLYAMADYAGALKDYETALELMPADYPMLFFKGLSHYKLRQYDEAVTCLDAAAALPEADGQQVCAARHWRMRAKFRRFWARLFKSRTK